MFVTDLDKKSIEEVISKMVAFVETESFHGVNLPKNFESEFFSEKYGHVKYAMRLYEFFNDKLNEKQYALKLMIALKQVNSREDISWGSMDKIKQDLLSYKQDSQLVLQKLPDLYMTMLS